MDDFVVHGTAIEGMRMQDEGFSYGSVLRRGVIVAFKSTGDAVKENFHKKSLL